ncbi:MAG: hypothetical protein IJS47_06595 [Clostridia bacterium]|nr:hypothetical protein [Clostridia bacterium]
MITRERIEALLDAKSFAEINSTNECGVICGYGTISNRPVCIYSHDENGIITKENLTKIEKIFDIAVKTGVPIISILETSKIKLDEGAGILKKLNGLLSKYVEFSGVIPEIAIVYGQCVGTMATLAHLNDFVFLVDGTLSSSITTLEPENSDIQLNVSENEIYNKIRELISFIPDNNLTDPDVVDNADLNRTTNIAEFLSTKVYDANKVVSEISDDMKFLTVNDVNCGFIRLGGRSVGVVANVTKQDSESFDKLARFVRFCDAFNIPLVTLINTSGMEDTSKIMKHAAKLFYAYAEATVPKISVVIGNAFGGAYIFSGGLNSDISYALDSAKISVLSNEAMEKIVGNAENSLEEVVKENLIDGIITPESIRIKLIGALYLLLGKRENRPVKKHGNIPL